MLEEILLGTTRVQIDDQEFLNGMDSGIEMCLFNAQPKPCITLSSIHRILWQAMIDDATDADPPSEAFRAGFAFGQLCALLHPDLDSADEHLTWVEALAAKYETLQKLRMAVAS